MRSSAYGSWRRRALHFLSPFRTRTLADGYNGHCRFCHCGALLSPFSSLHFLTSSYHCSSAAAALGCTFCVFASHPGGGPTAANQTAIHRIRRASEASQVATTTSTTAAASSSSSLSPAALYSPARCFHSGHDASRVQRLRQSGMTFNRPRGRDAFSQAFESRLRIVPYSHPSDLYGPVDANLLATSAEFWETPEGRRARAGWWRSSCGAADEDMNNSSGGDREGKPSASGEDSSAAPSAYSADDMVSPSSSVGARTNSGSGKTTTTPSSSLVAQPCPPQPPRLIPPVVDPAQALAGTALERRRAAAGDPMYSRILALRRAEAEALAARSDWHIVIADPLPAPPTHTVVASSAVGAAPVPFPSIHPLYYEAWWGASGGTSRHDRETETGKSAAATRAEGGDDDRESAAGNATPNAGANVDSVSSRSFSAEASSAPAAALKGHHGRRVYCQDDGRALYYKGESSNSHLRIRPAATEADADRTARMFEARTVKLSDYLALPDTSVQTPYLTNTSSSSSSPGDAADATLEKRGGGGDDDDKNSNNNNELVKQKPQHDALDTYTQVMPFFPAAARSHLSQSCQTTLLPGCDSREMTLQVPIYHRSNNTSDSTTGSSNNGAIHDQVELVRRPVRHHFYIAPVMEPYLDLAHLQREEAQVELITAYRNLFYEAAELFGAINNNTANNNDKRRRATVDYSADYVGGGRYDEGELRPHRYYNNGERFSPTPRTGAHTNSSNASGDSESESERYRGARTDNGNGSQTGGGPSTADAPSHNAYTGPDPFPKKKKNQPTEKDQEGSPHSSHPLQRRRRPVADVLRVPALGLSTCGARLAPEMGTLTRQSAIKAFHRLSDAAKEALILHSTFTVEIYVPAPLLGLTASASSSSSSSKTAAADTPKALSGASVGSENRKCDRHHQRRASTSEDDGTTTATTTTTTTSSEQTDDSNDGGGVGGNNNNNSSGSDDNTAEVEAEAAYSDDAMYDADPHLSTLRRTFAPAFTETNDEVWWPTPNSTMNPGRVALYPGLAPPPTLLAYEGWVGRRQELVDAVRAGELEADNLRRGIITSGTVGGGSAAAPLLSAGVAGSTTSPSSTQSLSLSSSQQQQQQQTAESRHGGGDSGGSDSGAEGQDAARPRWRRHYRDPRSSLRGTVYQLDGRPVVPAEALADIRVFGAAEERAERLAREAATARAAGLVAAEGNDDNKGIKKSPSSASNDNNSSSNASDSHHSGSSQSDAGSDGSHSRSGKNDKSNSPATHRNAVDVVDDDDDESGVHPFEAAVMEGARAYQQTAARRQYAPLRPGLGQRMYVGEGEEEKEEGGSSDAGSSK